MDMKRLPTESFEDYRKRRKDDNTLTRSKLRGKLFWHGLRGQYVKPENKRAVNG